MFTSEADRRARRAAANARIGHDRAYWIIYGEPVARVAVPIAAVLGGGVWLWNTVTPDQVSLAVGLVGILLVAVYAAWWVKTSSAQARIRARSMGTPRSIRMHLVGAAGVLLAIAAVALYGAA